MNPNDDIQMPDVGLGNMNNDWGAVVHNFREEQLLRHQQRAEMQEQGQKEKKDLVKETMKKRHLNQDERRHYHKPENDWKDTPKGEVCVSANTLNVDDIIKKYDMIVV